MTFRNDRDSDADNGYFNSSTKLFCETRVDINVILNNMIFKGIF